LVKRGLSYPFFHLSFLLILFTSAVSVFSQDSTIVSPFQKGRALLLVNASLSSSSVNEGATFSGFKYITNDYLLGAGALKLIKNRFGIGGQFYTGRTESTELVKLETEILYFGPWARFYWNNSQIGSLFPQFSLYYVNYFSNREFENLGTIYHESLQGKGIGTSLGVGYSYLVRSHVNLEVSMIYNLFYLFGNLQNELAQSDQEVDFMRSQIMFTVAVGILFEKRKSPR